MACVIGELGIVVDVANGTPDCGGKSSSGAGACRRVGGGAITVAERDD